MGLADQYKNGIVILGAGNVASHLSLALYHAGFYIKCIYSKSIDNAKKLAQQVDAHYTNEINHIPVEADLYIIAVKDEIIEQLIMPLNLKYGVVVHTAGSISMDVFTNKFENYGVFYPLQTFTKNRALDFSDIPICIEANSKALENKLFNLAKSLTKTVVYVDSENRKKMHLAAVFACNFANHMFAIAAEIVKQSDLPFELLKPLIRETTQKAMDSNPKQAQTGPAVRNDQNVIREHLKMLDESPEFEKIYRFVSDSIYKLNQSK